MAVKASNTWRCAATGTAGRGPGSGEIHKRLEQAVSAGKMKALLKVAEKARRGKSGFDCRSSLGPVEVSFSTNAFRLYRYWRENWFPPPSGAPGEPAAGAIAAAVDVPDQQSAAYYCREAGRVASLNCRSYRLCHDWALGLASHLAVRESFVGLRAATICLEGVGTAVFAEDPAPLAALALTAGARAGAQVQNTGWSWLNAEEAHRPAEAFRSERSLLIPGGCVWYARGLERALERMPSENVIRRKDQCTNLVCLERVDRGEMPCVFDAGSDRCYWSHPGSRALVHPSAGVTCRPADEPLPVEEVVLLNVAAEDRESELSEMESQEAAKHLCGRVESIGAPWTAAEMFQPVEHVCRRALQQCCRHARAATLTSSPGRFGEAVELLIERCAEHRSGE